MGLGLPLLLPTRHRLPETKPRAKDTNTNAKYATKCSTGSVVRRIVAIVMKTGSRIDASVAVAFPDGTPFFLSATSP